MRQPVGLVARRGLLFGVCLLLFATAWSARADVFVLAPTQDAYVAQVYPDTPRYQDAGLVTMMAYMNPRAFTYFQFDLASLPAGATITEATLWLYQTTDGTAPYGPQGTLLERISNDSWSEDTLTWDNQPAFASAAFGTSADGGLHTGWSSWIWNATATDPALDLTPADGLLSLFLEEGASATQSHVWLGTNYVNHPDVLAAYGAGLAPYLEVTTVGMPTAIPEPGSLALLGAALSGLLIAARWRKAR